jgi:N-acetylglutamate synthase-like GNAT family acetyltransferase
MKTCFTIKVSRWQIAIADLMQHTDKLYELTRINVPTVYQGRRYGTELLDMVLKEADANGVTVRLYPFASGALGGAALRRWYARRGFTRVAGHCYLYRPPKNSPLDMEIVKNRPREVGLACSG